MKLYAIAPIGCSKKNRCFPVVAGNFFRVLLSRWAWRRGGSDGGRPCWWERTRSACGTSTPAARWPTSTTRRRRSSERWCTTSDRRSSDCRRAPNRWRRVVTWWYTGFILRGSARKRYRLKPELIETWLALSNFDQLFSGEKTVGFLTGWKLPMLCAGRYLGSRNLLLALCGSPSSANGNASSRSFGHRGGHLWWPRS